MTQASDSNSPKSPDRKQPVSFQQAADEAQPGLVAEFIEFLKESKKWWLIPIVIVLLLVGLLVFLSSSVAAPFIYPLF